MNMLNVLIFSHKINFMKKMYFTLVNYYDPIIIHLYHSPILITLQVNHDIYMLITTISSTFCMQKVDEMVVMSIYMSWLTCNVIKIGE